MPIRLDRLKRIDPRTTADDRLPPESLGNTYVYKDVQLDIKFVGNNGNIPAKMIVDESDISDLRDGHDIKQSLTNLFNTKPGDRLTNPYFGLNLTTFLFDAITPIPADLMGRAILDGVGQFEPRVNITHLNIDGYPDTNEYRIQFSIEIADENISEISLVGVLNSDGFKFGES